MEFVEDDKAKKANQIFESMNIFKNTTLNQGNIKPMFSEKLEKKQR